MLLDVSARSGREPKRNHGAVANALDLDVGKTPATKGFRAWYVGGRNLDIETVAATISLVVIQGLVRAERDARSFD
jgi:hypothetical protein